MRKLILISLVCAAPLAAQTVVTIAPQQCVWHAGDNPAWAVESLDESSWQPYPTWHANTAEPHLWVRCHADLSSLTTTAQPALQVTLYSAYQFYVNGMLMGDEGSLANGNTTLNAVHTYSIPDQHISSGHVTLALRITNRVAITNSGPIRSLISSPLELRAGDSQLLDALRARTVLARAAPFVRTAIGFAIIGVLAVVLLGLFLFDRSRSELLLLSVGCLCLAGLRINEFAAASLLNYSVSTLLTIILFCNVGLTVTETAFFYAVARRRMPVAMIIVVALISVAYLPTAVDALFAANLPAWISALNQTFIRPFALFLHIAVSLIPFIIFWPYAAIPRRVRPLAMLCMVWGAVDTVWFALEVTSFSVPGVPDLFARWGLTLLAARAFSTVFVLTALFAILFRDQRQVTEERALFAGEIHAARDVQQYLIPAHLPATPGFSIESEYRPAREVGGDFFQVLPQAEGSLLIVIGDVAGKGIEAGMLATLIVGSVRTAATFTSDPARILALLNDRLYGRGLVTCLALRIDENGSATLVNAGHLPPYLNGNEMAIDGALPLGAVPGMLYTATRFSLDAGDSLMLMTDGVVEAQNSHGQLFGFDKIAALLSSGAGGAALADAAQQFGQEDDITVLTLAFTPVEVAHA